MINLANKITTAQVVEKTFTRDLPREGVALLRLQSYLELGVKAPTTAGYKPARTVRMTFELLHPDHQISGTKADGTTFAFPDTLVVYVNVSGPTGRFGKLFAKLNYDGQAVHMSQFVGKAFLGSITHNKSGDKTYANLTNAAGEWTVGAPTHTDPMTNETKVIPVPEMDGKPQVFLYDHPQLDDNDIREMWDSIYIEGEHPAKGDKPARTKNWIQDAISKSMDWDTSKTKAATQGDAPAATAMDDDLAALGL